MTKTRSFNYITDASATAATGDDSFVQYTYGFNFSTHEVESMDSFEEEVILVAYPVNDMQHIDSILRHFGLNDNSYYFANFKKQIKLIRKCG